MIPVNKQFVADLEPKNFTPLSWTHVIERLKTTTPLKLIWWCLAICIVSATWARYATDKTGLSYYLMMVLGSGGCAWFWLLSRSLFRSRQALQSKIMLLVPMIIVIEAFVALMPHSGTNAASNEFYRVFGNVASFVCIAVIVYVWHEALTGFKKIRSTSERRFRILFLSGFSLPVAVAVLWVMGAEANTLAAQWNDTILTACAFFALAGSRLAVEYRLRSSNTHATSYNGNGSETMESSAQLADKVIQAINDDALLTQANLKVADLAKHINEQEYKVTRCITSHLQYRNFNHLLNHHRIERAIGLLKDPNNNHLNVATIAYDCGFNSLGPFNRSFKQHTGMTPREFRLQ